MTRDEVIVEARNWIGTAWRHQGRSLWGVDCVGLLVVVARKFGLPIEDRCDYARDPTGQELLAHLRRHLHFVNPGSNLHGAIGVLREARLPCHVGFVSQVRGHLMLIHASAPRHAVVEQELDRRLLVECGKFPFLSD